MRCGRLTMRDIRSRRPRGWLPAGVIHLTATGCHLPGTAVRTSSAGEIPCPDHAPRLRAGVETLVQAEEFDALYAAAFPRLVRQLTLMTGDADAAQDAVQEAFVRAWSRRRSLRSTEQPEAWIRTTAWRLAVSRFRRLRRGRELMLRYHTPSTAKPPSPDRVLVEQALAAVPLQQRRVLVLHYLCDLSVEQISAETGAPAGTVKSWLARGRRSLAPLLDTEERQGTHA